MTGRNRVWLSAALTIALSAFLTTTTIGSVRRTAALPPPPASAPSGLAATGFNAKVTVTWAPVSGVTGYRIYRSTDGDWSAGPIGSTSGTTYNSYNLVNGTKYSFRVAAYNSGGIGPMSAVVSATPMAPPLGVVATGGDQTATVQWNASAGALFYDVFRKTGSETVYTLTASGVAALSFTQNGLTNGSWYYYKVRAVGDQGVSALSATASVKPNPPPPSLPPAGLTATPGNARVQLAWQAVAGATSYKIYRENGGVFMPLGSTSLTAYKDYSVTNGTQYSYRVAGRSAGGEGPMSNIVSATPIAPPVAPTGLTATASDHQVSLSWTASPAAVSYNLYRGTLSNKQSSTPFVTGLGNPSFVDANLPNGPTLFYKVTAVNAGGESPRSNEASGSPEGPAPTPDPATMAAFRLLRQATWGPKPGEVDALKLNGVDAFLADQFGAPISQYPSTLFSQPVEMTQEHFMHLALTGPDQLRQRVAFALHKIMVVSAVEVDKADAIVTYHQLLLNNAFGNYRDLMHEVTLNPAMGRYLNMLNNRGQNYTGKPANENYARELMQLFTVGIPRLNPNGSVMKDAQGLDIPVYTEADVKELARIFTGWTFGDGNPATVPTHSGTENYQVPMEAVARYHDNGAKTFLGHTFPAGQTASQDLSQALDVLFQHSNVAPFISRNLIQQLVTSNPSPGYVATVAAMFADNGAGIRGDLAAVVRAILTDPEAQSSSPSFGKLSEPVLFIVSQLRALNATVTDHPFMSDKAEEMGQKVLYPPSVFSYFSPGYRVRGTGVPPLGGPEFQILTTVTTLVRANFVGELLGGWFGSDVTVDYAPFTMIAVDPAALVDYCNALFMGGRMSPAERAEIISAVRVSSASRLRERVNTAIYLTLVVAQGQVDW